MVGAVVLKLREDVFEAVIRHDLSFYDEHPSGKIVSRVTSDTQDFSDVVTLVTNLISQVMLIVLLVVWLVRIEPLADPAAGRHVAAGRGHRPQLSPRGPHRHPALAGGSPR